MSEEPWIRSSRFQSVSPCRAGGAWSASRLAADGSRTDGKACVVTGSTGGIGLETARLLVAEGARVVTCRPERGARDRRGAPRAGRPVRAGRAGTAGRAAVERARGLDVLVNNVGFAVQARFEEVPDEEWDSMWQLNVMSYVRAIRAALPHLRASSGRDRQRLLDRGQAAVDRRCRTTRSRRRRCSRSRGSSPTSTRATGSAATRSRPGPTATEAWLGEGGLADQQGGSRDEVLAKVGAGRPLGRLAEPEEIAVRDRVPRLRAGLVRHRRGVVAPTAAPSRSSSEARLPAHVRVRAVMSRGPSGDCPRTGLDRTCPRVNLQQRFSTAADDARARLRDPPSGIP